MNRLQQQSIIVIICGIFILALTPGVSLSDPPSLAKVTINAGGAFEGGPFDTFKTELNGEVIDVSYFPGEGRYRITYAVPPSGSYAGIKINDVSINPNGHLSFRVKGSAANIPLKIELQHSGAGGSVLDSAYLYITDYLDGGITTEWRTVQIPIDAFANLNDPASVNALVFVFEHDYAVTNGFPTQGILEIDSINFSDSFLGYVRVDHFGDNWGWVAVGGNMGNMGGLPDRHSFSFENGHNYAHALKSVYNVPNLDEDPDDPPTNWCGLFMILGGGSNGWTPKAIDSSRYNSFTLWVRAASASQNPRICKLELESNGGTARVFLTNVTTSWQRYTVDLNQLIDFDKGSIKQINIVYEKSGLGGNGIIDKGGSLVGVVYFDELQFE